MSQILVSILTHLILMTTLRDKYCLENKLRHIKMLQVYLSKIGSNQAKPEVGKITAPTRASGKTLIEKTQKQSKAII